jgi:hypothetical protein
MDEIGPVLDAERAREQAGARQQVSAMLETHNVATAGDRRCHAEFSGSRSDVDDCSNSALFEPPRRLDGNDERCPVTCREAAYRLREELIKRGIWRAYPSSQCVEDACRVGIRGHGFGTVSHSHRCAGARKRAEVCRHESGASVDVSRRRRWKNRHHPRGRTFATS